VDAIVPGQRSAVAICAGDDVTDEDALPEVRESGLGIVVRSGEAGDRPTHAHVAVDDTEELAELLARFADHLRQ
jgi:trehalose 6-phosphate phosphatase